MKKKLLLLLGVAVLIATMVIGVQVASAETEGVLTYKISNGEVTITGCNTSAAGELVIPAEIKGYPVTSIGAFAFGYCDALKSVTIPESVTSIGSKAFYYCDGLTSITIPEGVTIIENYVFDGCSNLTSITIPNSVISIGGYTFRKCSSLTSITIPEGITCIWGYTFYGCSSLTSVKLPEGVRWIYERAFDGCSSLTSITIPESVTSIGKFAFNGCSSLTSITIPENVTSIDSSTFWLCSNLTSVTLPESVTSIGDSAFYKCSSLTSITIPESVTSIGGSAFSGCSSLTSMTIPESVKEIGNGAFYGCKKLSSVKYGGTEADFGEISIYDNNETLLNAEISFAPAPKLEAAESIIADTGFTIDVVGEEYVIVISEPDIVITETEFAEMLNGAEYTINSNNGIIGTGCKIGVGEYEFEIVKMGDLDGDGVSNVFDALIAKRALDAESGSEYSFDGKEIREYAADVDGESGTTAADVTYLLKMAIGAIAE